MLAAALKAGGMVPELRAMRLKEIAERVINEFDGDLRGALVRQLRGRRAALRKFPGIADPGADRILLFAHLAPIAAIPSNCPHVLTRVLTGTGEKNYNASYRGAQSAVASEVPEEFHSRSRAYLLLKQHGQTLCKRTNPQCPGCPVKTHCAYAGGK
jgi:endonuclease III